HRQTYDGTHTTIVRTTDPGSVVNLDNVSLSITAASFSDKNVANGKTVTANTFSLIGTDASNYALDGVSTTTANITAKHVTGSFTADGKTYDVTTPATV